MPLLHDPALLFQNPEHAHHPRVMDVYTKTHHSSEEDLADQILDDI
jgi:hypothetical protein